MSSPPPAPRVAIVGAGFCGAALTHHLAAASVPLEIALIERAGDFGPGLAYATTDPRHLLNTPAGRMSALAGDPDHFTRWAGARDPAVEGGSFLPRARYGEYLRALVDAAGSRGRVTCISGQVVAAAPEGAGAALQLADGRRLSAARVVLATGNQPPADPPALPGWLRDDPRYRGDPWTGAPPQRDHAVLVLGTGLTALDLALGLRGAGHRGPVHLLSRRGLLPHAHRAPARAYAAPAPATEAWPATARGLLHGVRAAVREAAARGVDWREVVAGLRPLTQALWQRLPLAEQARCVAHLRSYWEVHRHRAAPETAAGIAAMRASGQLAVHAGRVLEISGDAGALRVTYAPRGGGRPRTLAVDHLYNATGPASDLRRAADPLLRDLVAQGLLVPDPLALGARVDADGALLDAAGTPSRWLYTAGALRRPQLWETTAVLELAPQVEALARTLLAGLADAPADMSA